MTTPKLYRPAAGIALFSRTGKLFLGRRASAVSKAVPSGFFWQMPQGGIDPGEDAMAAAIRELREETGVRPCHISPLGWSEDWLIYDFPADYQGSRKARGFSGQKQMWFAFLFTGTDADINLNAQQPPEFSDWRWGSLDEAVNLIVPFKKKVYRNIARQFRRFETSVHGQTGDTP